jgi:hypothetical protein
MENKFSILDYLDAITRTGAYDEPNNMNKIKGNCMPMKNIRDRERPVKGIENDYF